MGKPVAFEARADERDTRGFISTTTISPFAGLTANWTLEPPVSTPISRMMAMEALRRTWYSTSVSVWAGATVMESPVCTPMGSKFSMEQMMTTLSAPSRMTSSSYSFQPMTDSSMSTSLKGESSRPLATISRSSDSFSAMPAPVPPRVDDGRTMSGNPRSSAICSAPRML